MTLTPIAIGTTQTLTPSQSVEIVNDTEATYTVWCGRSDHGLPWEEQIRPEITTDDRPSGPIELSTIVTTKDGRVLGFCTDGEAREWLGEHVRDFTGAWSGRAWRRTAQEAIDRINRAEGETP